jgi:hypothetical protein
VRANSAAGRRPYANCEQLLRRRESNLLEEMGDLECGSVNEPRPALVKPRGSFHLRIRRACTFAYEGNLQLKMLSRLSRAETGIHHHIASGIYSAMRRSRLAGGQPPHFEWESGEPRSGAGDEARLAIL